MQIFLEIQLTNSSTASQSKILASLISAYIEKNPLRPAVGDDWIDGQIIFIDNFENVIVNITRHEFEELRKGRGFKINFKRDEVIDHISETYADVPEGEKLALFNSAGYLEIAINKGNAAGLAWAKRIFRKKFTVKTDLTKPTFLSNSKNKF